MIETLLELLTNSFGAGVPDRLGNRFLTVILLVGALLFAALAALVPLALLLRYVQIPALIAILPLLLLAWISFTLARRFWTR
jgi:hypothetical protein